MQLSDIILPLEAFMQTNLDCITNSSCCPRLYSSQRAFATVEVALFFITLVGALAALSSFYNMSSEWVFWPAAAASAVSFTLFANSSRG